MTFFHKNKQTFSVIDGLFFKFCMRSFGFYILFCYTLSNKQIFWFEIFLFTKWKNARLILNKTLKSIGIFEKKNRFIIKII